MLRSGGILPTSFVISLLIAILYVTSCFAQQATSGLDERLKKVEEAIEEGRKKSSELDRASENLQKKLLKLQHDRVKIATTIRKTESHIFRLDNELRTLKENEAKKLGFLNKRRDQFVQVIVALQRLSHLPPQAVIAYPTPPSDLVRTGILLRATVPRIERQASQFRDELTSLELTRTQIAKRRSELVEATSVLKKRRLEVDLLSNSKAGVRRQTLAARQVQAARLQRLTREAQTLRDLFDSLEKERLNRGLSSDETIQNLPPNTTPSPMPRRLDPIGAIKSKPPLQTRPITTARGALTFPVIGKIKGSYGFRETTGETRKGIHIESGPGAQVVAPYNGRIVFAGPFRGYGRLLIIEHGQGYHSLLAGMARIQGLVGQWLLSGEPVGIMGTPLSGKPALYMEFRRNGQPVNPKPWLMTEKGNISR